MKMKKMKFMVIGLLACACMVGYADILVGLNANGELWRADTTDVPGTKQLLSTLAGGVSYVDSAFDGQYLYGLRSDGAVYRSDLSGNVSQVPVTGWGNVTAINAKQGTLYGMDRISVANSTKIMGVDGNAAVTVGSTSTWVDFSIADNGNFWMLTGGGQAKSYCYAFAPGYSGDTSGTVGFVSQGNADGVAIDTSGSDLFVLRVYSTATVLYRNSDWVDATGVAHIDIAETGDLVYFIEANGGIRSLPKAGGSRLFYNGLYDTGSAFVGLEAIPEPGTVCLIAFSSIGLLVVRRMTGR